MSELYTEILPDDDEEPGIHRRDFSTAVSVWSWMQQRPVSVADAAMAFSTTPELIRQAVSDNYWMLLCPSVDEPDPTKQFIEHDGE